MLPEMQRGRERVKGVGIDVSWLGLGKLFTEISFLVVQRSVRMEGQEGKQRMVSLSNKKKPMAHWPLMPFQLINNLLQVICKFSTVQLQTTVTANGI